MILQIESGTTGKIKLRILDMNVKIKRVGIEKNILLLWKQKEINIKQKCHLESCSCGLFWFFAGHQ